MFEPGQTVRHIQSGETAEFRRVFSQNRGVTKVVTSGPWGPIDVECFEEAETEEKPNWPLKMDAQAYLDRYGEDSKNSELAMTVLGL